MLARMYRTERRTETLTPRAQLVSLHSTHRTFPHYSSRSAHPYRLSVCRKVARNTRSDREKYPRAKKNERVKCERTKNIFSRCTLSTKADKKNCNTHTTSRRKLLVQNVFQRKLQLLKASIFISVF